MRHFRMPRAGGHGGNPERLRSQRQAIRKARRSALARLDNDGLKRESFLLPKNKATAKACEMLRRFPKRTYWTKMENWRETADGKIAFTLCRLEMAR